MKNFGCLSPIEFEQLSRDLIQRHLGVFFETFAEGRDQGIDNRTSLNGELTVLQSKRYSKATDLLAVLKKEAKKIPPLNIQRYILSTTVRLTPNLKDQIFAIMEPFIKTTVDIYGLDDLDNLLTQYPDIEEHFPKLWMSDAAALRRILHSSIRNESSFHVGRIAARAKLFVPHEGYFEAMRKLEQNHLVILSGAPGVGKTTIAEMLTLDLMKKGECELVAIGDSIEKAWTSFDDYHAQIFYFDDFLGENFLLSSLPKNEAHRIVEFLQLIAQSENKRMVLATREYILQQAYGAYEILEQARLDLSKCVIDLQAYTRRVRAEILFQHLFHSSVPTEAIEVILESKVYLAIANHKHYNPRLVESLSIELARNNVAPDEVAAFVVDAFDKPFSLWEHVYHNQVSQASRFFLLCLFSFGRPVLLEDVLKQFRNLARKIPVLQSLHIDQNWVSRCLRELEVTFITTEVDSNVERAVSFVNPSVRDFMAVVAAHDMETVETIIKTAECIEQFITFEGFLTKDLVSFQERAKMGEAMERRLKADLDELISCRIIKWKSERTGKDTWRRDQMSMMTKLDAAVDVLRLFERNIDMSKFAERFRLELHGSSYEQWDIGKIESLCETLGLLQMGVLEEVYNFGMEHIWLIDDLCALLRFIVDRTDGSLIIPGEVASKCSDILLDVNDVHDDDVDEVVRDLSLIEELSGADLSSLKDQLLDREHHTARHGERLLGQPSFVKQAPAADISDEEITRMFSRLLEKIVLKEGFSREKWS